MIFETLMQVPLMATVIGCAFVTIIAIGVIEFSYRTEDMGDEE